MKQKEIAKILTEISRNTNLSQRKLAEDLGFSLGKLNYSLKTLQKKGFIRFKKSKIYKKNLNKISYEITNKAKYLEDFIEKDNNILDLNLFNRKRTFLIAEIGINHNGSLLEAKKLIKLAKKHDFDAVKFQKRDLNICIPENQKNIMRETPWGTITYLDYKKKIEFNLNQYKKLSNYSKEIGIEMFASCWDLNSLKSMKKMNFKYNKIASAMITNKNFLQAVAKEGKKTFISTGMCNMKDIQEAVKIFNSFKCKFILMHSVSQYPCDETVLNLNLIRTLKKKFNCEVGYSGHESSVSPTITAFFLGADYIERHITLDRANWGTDQAASLSETGIEQLTTLIRKIPHTVGNGKKVFLPSEKKVSKKMRYWEQKNYV
jgi:N-acetylneuraminate synthase